MNATHLVGPTLADSARHIAETCIAHRLRLLTRVVSRLFNSELDGSGLTVSQFNILTFLLNSPGASPSHVAAALELEKSSVSRNLELMRKNGWIDAKSEGRGQVLKLTRSGAATYRAAIARWQQAQDRVQQLLGPTATRNILAMTERLETRRK
jgi:DNA-binding MarR family transcriptional regulator